MNKEPYRLFDYYRYEDREIFFGRDEEVARLVGDILSARLLALFAPSGSGKSSLLRAGVQPALEKRDFETAFTRVGEDPIVSIIQALERLDSTASCGATDLVTVLKGRAKPVVVVIDQFEELFLQFGEDSSVRTDFPVKLAEALFDPSLRVYFVLSLRSEYFVCLNEFREAIPTIFHNNANLELRPFDHDAACKAIRGPSERPDSGFTWEKGLPERIAHDLADSAINQRGNGVLPITLQVVCHTFWSRLEGKRGEITARAYESAGGAAAILDRRIFKPLEDTSDRRLLCRLLRELITKDGTKRIRSVADLHEALYRVRPNRTQGLIERLDKELLLRGEERAEGEIWVELRHDYLAARMKPWLDEEERRLDSQRRRRSVVMAAVTAIFVGLCVWLWIDYHAYKGQLGATGHEMDLGDELIVRRTSVFWPLEIRTGFTRPLLQISGVERDSFDVPDALSDWSAVAIRLAKPARDRYELATQLDDFIATNEAQRKKASTASVGAIQGADIGLYWAADDKVFRLVTYTLKQGSSEARRTAASALGTLGAGIPADRIEKVTTVLLTALKDKESDSNVKSSAADALATLGANLPADRIEEVTTVLLTALEESGSNVKSSAAAALGRLRLPADRTGDVIAALLAALRGSDSIVKSSAPDLLGTPSASLSFSDRTRNIKNSAASALGALGASLPIGQIGEVTTSLLAALKESDSNIKSSDALGTLSASLPADRIGEFITALLDALKESDSSIKSSAADALGMLGVRLPADRIGEVTTALLAALKDKESGSNVKGSAAVALGTLGAGIPADRLGEVTTALLAALKDKESDSNVKRCAVVALATLGASLPADRIGEVTTALLAALKDKESDSNVKSYAVVALATFGANLPADLIGEVTTVLLAALKESDGFVKRSAADALGRLGASLPADRIGEFITALLGALKESDSRVKSSVANALGTLGVRLPADRIGEVTTALLAALKDKESDSNAKSSAASALGASLPADRIGEVATALLAALKDKESGSNVKSSAADALGALGASLPADRIGEVTTALLAALKDKGSGSNVKSSSASALGALDARLPADQIGEVITALLSLLKDSDSDVKDSVAKAFGALAGRINEAQKTESVVFSLSLASGGISDVSEEESLWTTVNSTIRKLTRTFKKPETGNLIRNLEDFDSRKRTLAVHALARRSLEPYQQKRIRDLRDDPESRPWVRMAALDTLMEIEREKVAVARDKEEAAKKSKKAEEGSRRTK